MVSDRKLAHAVGKPGRACDNCARKGARWYCTADDAFLCESCDSLVHSANPLARRHERVRLKIVEEEGSKACAPSWHQGFTRKARTPRPKKLSNRLRVVPEPEIGSEEESDEQLLYRVPVLETAVENYKSKADESSNNHFPESELDLADFAADVESLLGKGLDDDLEGLGISEKDNCCGRIIKDEDEEENNIINGEARLQLDEVLELNFDYITFEDENISKIQNHEFKVEDDSTKALLKLDYERVISAWDDNKSPWTTGEKPEFTSHGWWLPPDCCLGASGRMRMRNGQVAAAAGDGGREARVSRYREKRRTRLFSKKIRYEVRKLNAEKRPRMKGRFVKRASFAASAFPLLNK